MVSKNKRPFIARIIVAGCLLLADVLLLPWLMKFPQFLIASTAKTFMSVPERWFNYGPIHSIKDVLVLPQLRKAYLYFQPLIGFLLLLIFFNSSKSGSKFKLSDGVGGPDPAGSGQHGTSRWQNSKEMDRNATVWYTNTPLKSGGVIYGMDQLRDKSKVWLNDDDTHTLLLASTRSGKSRKILLPTIWNLGKAGESMVLGDVKGELYDASSDYLRSIGYNVITLNLREPRKGNQWNVLDPINRAIKDGDMPKANEIAWDIANDISNQKLGAASDAPIWENGNESTLAALILLAAIESEFEFQKHMASVYYLLATYGEPLDDGSVPLLEYIHTLNPTHPARSAFATAAIAPYKTRASFFTTALANLRLFSDANVADMTALQDHDMRSIGIDKTAVFLIIPDEKKTRHVLATLYVDQVYQTMVDLANEKGGRIPRRVNFLLDEFGNLPAINNFDSKITVAGGRGMRFLLSLQSLTQIDTSYNKQASTIRGNCATWMYLATMDDKTADILSKMTGKYTVQTENSSSSVQTKSNGHTSMSHGQGLTGRSLLLPDEILRWDKNYSLIFAQGRFPAKYPLPDLSEWSANTDFGYVAPSGNVREDMEANRQINEKRRQKYPVRSITPLQLWSPFMIDSEFTENEPMLEIDNIPFKEVVNTSDTDISTNEDSLESLLKQTQINSSLPDQNEEDERIL